MTGIFPSVEDIETELDRLRAEREALDAAIAERQLFVELGRRLAGQRRGAARAPAPVQAPAPAQGPARAEPAPAPPRAVREPIALGAHAPGPDGEPLTPRTVARARGRALVAEAVAILRAQDRPMHAAELVPLLAERGYVLPGHDPVAALNTRLWKRARTGRFVIRHGDAVYAAGDEADGA